MARQTARQVASARRKRTVFPPRCREPVDGAVAPSAEMWKFSFPGRLGVSPIRRQVLPGHTAAPRNGGSLGRRTRSRNAPHLPSPPAAGELPRNPELVRKAREEGRSQSWISRRFGGRGPQGVVPGPFANPDRGGPRIRGPQAVPGRAPTPGAMTDPAWRRARLSLAATPPQSCHILAKLGDPHAIV